MVRLPTLGLSVNQTAQELENRCVNGVSTTKTVGKDSPVFEPTDAVFNTDANTTQVVVEGFLLGGQFVAFGFLKRNFQGEAGNSCTLVVQPVIDLLGQALISLVQQSINPVGQTLDGVGVIS